MNKKYLAISFGVLTSLNTISSEAALSSSALLGFDSGVLEYDIYGTVINIQGSYFSVDTNDDGIFTVFESLTMSPGTDGGLLLGQAQLATIPSTSTLDGTETAPQHIAEATFTRVKEAIKHRH